MPSGPIVQLHSSLGRSATWKWPLDAAAEAWMICNSTTLQTQLITPAGIERSWTDPLDALRWMQTFPLGRPAGARWIGYLSYDLGRLFETFASPPPDDLNLPLFAFSFHRTPELPTPGQRVLPTARIPHSTSSTPLTSNFTEPAWFSAVGRIIDYIRAGDVFQVNLSQRFTASLPTQPIEIWNRALAQSPPAYGAFLDYDDFSLISLSPELFLRVHDRQILTRPIKGTRPLQLGMDIALRESRKDAAELNMIVDLERNDLGRICEIGSVCVTEPRTIETHPTVYHGVATIAGTLRPEIRFVDILRAMFPGGSITGAPKIRAMQIIDELEPTRRGPYCGVIGYLSADGSMEFNIAIRTMIAKDGLVHVPVGGGIVADSIADDEYHETLVKARTMFNALQIP